MAPKKRLLIDNPPSASSTSDDSSSDDANQYIQLPSKHPVVEVDSSSNEEVNSSSSEDVQHSQPPSQNPPPSTPISNPKPVATSESGSQSESEPLGSTPRSGTKRSLDNNNNANASDAKLSKKKKKKTVSACGGSDENDEMEEDVRLIGDDSKKSSHRLFSEEDELAILKGLAIFTSETGKDPLNDSIDFHSFVKKSLCAAATSQQLKRKVRSLKKKFETNESFTKSHDKKAFELFKKISWVFNGGNAENGKVLSGKSPKKDATVKHVGSTSKKVESGVDNFILNEIFSFDKDFVKEGLESIEESKKAEIQGKYKQMQIAELEVFVNRAQLIKDQTNSVVKALEKSTN